MRGMLPGALMIALLVPTAVAAQPAADPGRANVSQGDRVRVTDEAGRTITGRVAAISEFGLTLHHDSRRLDFSYPTIVKIERPRDRLWDGALGGFALGAGLGLIAVATEETRTCLPDEWFCGASFGPAPSAVVLLFGGIGAGIGVGVDSLIGGRKTLFERGKKVHIVPLVTPRTAAARITVGW